MHLNIMIRLIAKAGSNIFRFAEAPKNPKSVNQYLKMKKNEEIATQLNLNQDKPEELQMAHRLLYAQFFPAAVIALPIMFLMGNPSDAIFLSSCNMMQYYLSGLLCFNSFFTQHNMSRYYYFIFAAVASNCITGPYGLVTPVLLGLLNFYAPFTDQKYHKFETKEQETKVKAYLKVQGLYYFLIGLVLTLKFYHFQTIRQFQLKLKRLEDENRQYFQTLKE